MTAFVVPGKPMAKGRPRFARGKGGKMFTYTPKTTVSYENLVKTIAMKHFKKPLEGPVKLSITFLIPRPKYLIWKTKPMPRVLHDKHLDLSNMLKSIEDALNGIAYRDDGQIARIYMEKEYHAGDEGPQAIIEIESIETEKT